MMRISAVRDLEGMQPVLREKAAKGPDPAYWVFSEISPSKEWSNLTIVAAGRYGKEYPKTFGHYHSRPIGEVYQRVKGEGLLLLQKRHYSSGVWVPEEVEEVLIITAKDGDEVTISPDYGHSWSNVGDLPLILFDNWKSGHEASDYVFIEKLSGLAYYIIEEKGVPKAVPNPHYKNLPEPVWLSATQLRERQI